MYTGAANNRSDWGGVVIAGAVALALAIMLLVLGLTGVHAQGPNPVLPGYQVCNTSDPGNTRCSWNPVDATHGLPMESVDMMPVNGPTATSGLQSCSSACNATTLLGPIDTSGYSGISVQITSIGGGATLAFQGSNDPVCSSATNWTSAGAAPDNAAFGPGNGTTSSYITSTTTANSYRVQSTYHCFRLQFTAYTSGTVSAQGFLRSAPVGPIPVWGGFSALTAVQCVYYGSCSTSGVGSATPITGNASGTTGAVVGTLAGVASKTTYICGFNVQAIGGTAPVGPVTVAGLIGSSQTYQGSASAAGGVVASQVYTPCIPASTTNTAITITTTANGTATAVNVNSWGFQL